MNGRVEFEALLGAAREAARMHGGTVHVTTLEDRSRAVMTGAEPVYRYATIALETASSDAAVAWLAAVVADLPVRGWYATVLPCAHVVDARVAFAGPLDAEEV